MESALQFSGGAVHRRLGVVVHVLILVGAAKFRCRKRGDWRRCDCAGVDVYAANPAIGAVLKAAFWIARILWLATQHERCSFAIDSAEDVLRI